MYTIQRVTCEISRCTNAKFAALGRRRRCPYGQCNIVYFGTSVEDMATDSQRCNIRHTVQYNEPSVRSHGQLLSCHSTAMHGPLVDFAATNKKNFK